VGVFKCSLAHHNFKIVLVINGLDEINSDRHTIEDHLIKATIGRLEGRGSSKERWTALDKEEKRRTFVRLKEETTINEIFPQQLAGFAYIAEN